MGKEKGEMLGGNTLIIPDDGEMLVIPKKNTKSPEFIKALHKFQYGEGEESDEGFEEMQRIATTEQEDSSSDDS